MAGHRRQSKHRQQPKRGYVTHRQTIYMVLAYEKSDQENLTEAHRAQLKQLAAIIKHGSA